MITIRPAIPADGDAIVAANIAMAQETENKTLDRDTTAQGVAALINHPDRGRYYVADAGGEVVGQLAVTWEWSDWRNGTFWWIQSVYVAPTVRGRGVFKMLYRHVADEAAGHSNVCGLRLYVDKSNHGAAEVYRRLGMTTTHYDMLEVDFTG